MGLTDGASKGIEKGMDLSHSSVAEKEELLDEDVLSFTSSDLTVSALLASSQEEQNVALEDKDVSELSQPACPTYDELLEVMSGATDRLNLPWRCKRCKMAV